MMSSGKNGQKWGLRAMLALLAASMWSCGPDFDPYWRVEELRVLAIQADPVVLQGGESATLRVLAHHPEGQSVQYSWEWCPFRVSSQNRYACPMTVDTLNQMLQQQNPGGMQLPEDFFELGTGAEVSFGYPGTPQLILGFCEAIVAAVSDASADSPLGGQLSVMDCERGFEVSVRMVATMGDQEIVSRKRVLLSTGPKTQLNKNPVVTGIEIKLADEADVDQVRDLLPWVAATHPEPGMLTWHQLPADAPLPVVAGVKFKVRATVDPLSVEEWTPRAPQGSNREFLDPRPEVFMYRWFVSAGTLEKPVSLYVDGTNTLDEASETEFIIKRDANAKPGDEIFLWSVVRDGRLGQDFVARRVQLVAP